MENPSAFAGEATNANSAAFGEAKTIQEAQAQKIGDIVGGVVGLGSAAFTGGMSALSGSSLFKGMGQNAVGNFVSPGFTPENASVPNIPMTSPDVASDWSVGG